MDRPQISAVLIAKNEEALLGRCLDSLKGLDRIVVVDTGSTDKTVEVAKAHGADIVSQGEFAWCDDFAKARNFAQTYALPGGWIFVIDADEYLPEGGVDRLYQAAKAFGDKRAINVNVVAEVGHSRHQQPRLYKNAPDIVWRGRVHNYLSVLGEADSGVEIMSGWSPAHAKDPNRALRMLEIAVKEEPESSRYWYYLGREYGYKNRWKESEMALRNCLAKTKWVPERVDAQFLLARALWYQRKGQDARNECLKAIGLNPDFKEAILFMAEMSFPDTAKIWRKYADLAQSNGVLFRRVA